MKSDYGRNIITIMTGTSIAQAIPIAISPILTRIYTPEDFGLFAVYMAIASIIGVAASGRYELAIMLPKKDEDAYHIVCLSFLITLTLSLFLLVIVFFTNDYIVEKIGRPDISKWLYLIPFSVFVTGLYNSFNYWSNRNKHYRTIAINRTIQSSTTNITQLVVGYLSSLNGLVLGALLGQMSALFFLVKKSTISNSKKYSFSLKKIIFNAKEYKKFPLLDVPAALINLVANQAPNLLLSSLFSPSITGFYYLTQRVLQAPVTLISGSVLDVFKQRASHDYKLYGNCKNIYKKTFFLLLALAFPPSIILLIWVVDIFELVFGVDWRVAGEYAQILIPALFLKFIANPLSFVIYIADKQHINLIGMSFLCFAVVASLFMADTPDTAIIMISASFFITYLFYLFMSAKLAKLI